MANILHFQAPNSLISGTTAVTPIVGVIKKDFRLEKLKISRGEVAEVFTKSMKDLSDPKITGYTQFRAPERAGYSLPIYKTEPHQIWGMTAIMTFQFLHIFLRKRGYKHKLNFQSPLKFD